MEIKEIFKDTGGMAEVGDFGGDEDCAKETMSHYMPYVSRCRDQHTCIRLAADRQAIGRAGL